MDQRFKKIRFPLILLLSFSISVFAAWVNSCDLAEADFLSSGTRFENPDPDTSLAYTNAKARVMEIGLDSAALCLEDHSLGTFSPLAKTSSILPSKVAILRC